MNHSLNENIKQLRVQNGLNQVELARAMNVTKQCVSNWENDNVQPSVEMLVRLADYFRVSADFLLGREASCPIDVSGLTEAQCAHVRLLVSDLAAANTARG